MSWTLAAAGGALIGLAALLLYATLGRIAGISGIAFGALWGAGTERHWRWAFIAGLVLGGWAAALAGIPLPAAGLTTGAAFLLIGAGLLVGAGTRMGNGCTSGHGICGLARLSPRSLAAVVAFMAVGMLVATLFRPLLI